MAHALNRLAHWQGSVLAWRVCLFMNWRCESPCRDCMLIILRLSMNPSVPNLTCLLSNSHTAVLQDAGRLLLDWMMLYMHIKYSNNRIFSIRRQFILTTSKSNERWRQNRFHISRCLLPASQNTLASIPNCQCQKLLCSSICGLSCLNSSITGCWKEATGAGNSFSLTQAHTHMYTPLWLRAGRLPWPVWQARLRFCHHPRGPSWRCRCRCAGGLDSETGPPPCLSLLRRACAHLQTHLYINKVVSRFVS